MILRTQSNAVTAARHDCMPGNFQEEGLRHLARAGDHGGEIVAYPFLPSVVSSRNESPDLIALLASAGDPRHPALVSRPHK